LGGGCIGSSIVERTSIHLCFCVTPVNEESSIIKIKKIKGREEEEEGGERCKRRRKTIPLCCHEICNQ
jgi:hypothetical protein